MKQDGLFMDRMKSLFCSGVAGGLRVILGLLRGQISHDICCPQKSS